MEQPPMPCRRWCRLDYSNYSVSRVKLPIPIPISCSCSCSVANPETCTYTHTSSSSSSSPRPVLKTCSRPCSGRQLLLLAIQL
jgi:hypothetical protein